EIGIARLAGEDDRAGRQESAAQRGNRRHRSRPRRRARHGLDDVDAGIEAVALEAAEEERAILRNRAADRSAELILFQERLAEERAGAAVGVARRVEVVRSVERVTTQVLERGAVHAVRAGLGDHADLAAAARAVLGGIGARFDAELLDVLE